MEMEGWSEVLLLEEGAQLLSSALFIRFVKLVILTRKSLNQLVWDVYIGYFGGVPLASNQLGRYGMYTCSSFASGIR